MDLDKLASHPWWLSFSTLVQITPNRVHPENSFIFIPAIKLKIFSHEEQ